MPLKSLFYAALIACTVLTTPLNADQNSHSYASMELTDRGLQVHGQDVLRSDSPITQDWLQKAFTGLSISKDQLWSEGEPYPVFVLLDKDEHLLTLTPDADTLFSMAIFSDRIMLPGKALAGKSRYKSIYQQSEPYCYPGEEELSGSVLCKAPDSQQIVLVFQPETPWAGPDGELPPEQVFSNWVLDHAIWLNRDI
ncbi:DUF1131 family protein [Oceanospirillum sediminis]|uniref:DUF1131 family protein n=1 Tax=Oceanospirillum sediminis TaxID=2760088 RepID=A0A839IM08_9GAMM|nr:DUF1131 family protein [Oceanospirillum sediminis]MBB1485931.1 DUF1131 family protein [Oceanospirillum sediminis]